MSRQKKAEVILEAAEKWKEQCLLNSGSLLTQQRLWTRENFEYLRQHYVENLDESGDSFKDKLRRQLDPTPSEAKFLWAEITWLYYLIVNSVRPVTKRDKIMTVWEWTGESGFPENHWALGEVLEGGILNPGRGYSGHQWREYRFIVMMMLDWYRHSEEKRNSLINAPWEFADWVYNLDDGRQRQFSHAILFLLFPDEFEPIMSISHKRKIVKAFNSTLVEPSKIGEIDHVSVDRLLLEVRNSLVSEHRGKEINFYDPELEIVWRGEEPGQGDDSNSTGQNDETWYKERFGEADVWAISTAGYANLWEEFQTNEIIAIGWDNLGDLSSYQSKEEIRNELIEHGASQNPVHQSLANWQFVHEMNIGDYVLAKRGTRTILGLGVVKGDYTYDKERTENRSIREVEWHLCQPSITLEQPITPKRLTRFTQFKAFLRSVFESIDKQGQHSEGKIEVYGLKTAMRDLFIEESQFCRILESLERNKNMILQGPPGVGKTFIARRIAWCVTGRKDSQSIGMVQFHQSYSYEDFVQGWRPTKKGGFTLRQGVFFKFCKLAENNPDIPHVFIIDEINRGNLSRILGELLMLIEADKRGKEHAISLTYSSSGELFSVPDNVHILGLMNTADRSLAIVDYALRRRFGFETLDPAFRTDGYRDYLLNANVDRDLVNRIVENLSAVNKIISEDKDLGPGYQIGHSYFMPEADQVDDQWYLAIVDSQIAPLLREYWFDRTSVAENSIGILRQ